MSIVTQTKQLRQRKLEYIKREELPILIVRIGKKELRQKCIGHKDKEFEFELCDEVLDYTFNNAAIIWDDMKGSVVECSEFIHPIFSRISRTGERLLFCYTKKDMRLRDICTTLHFKESTTVYTFQIHLTQGLRNRVMVCIPSWVIHNFLPITAPPILLFISFLWIIHLVQVLFKKITTSKRIDTE